MTRKHYIAIADVIKEYVKPNHLVYGFTNHKDDLVSELCRVFEEDNPRFDSDKFREACYER